MSQNMRNQPGEGQGNSGRGDEHQERKRFDGFEGMNYEQKRQPFNPQHTTNSRNQDEDVTGRKSKEE
ncbi:MAG: hypothetical protein ACXWB9_11430 [Flavisolibacter sp.]